MPSRSLREIARAPRRSSARSSSSSRSPSAASAARVAATMLVGLDLHLGQRARLHVVGRVRERILQHLRDLGVGQAVRRLDRDRGLDAGRLLARARPSSRPSASTWNVTRMRAAPATIGGMPRSSKRAERAAIGHLLALALHDVDRHRGLAVLVRRELLRARDRESSNCAG